MAFLNIDDGANDIDLDVEIDSARETEADAIGSTSRAFDGSWRSDKETFRTWSFVAIVSPADLATLRGIVLNDKAVTVSGDAVGAGDVDGIVQLGEASYLDDNREGVGFSHAVALTVRQG